MTASIAAAFARVRGDGFAGRATKLADLDLPYAGDMIGIGEDELHAVLDVETAGGGFDGQSRPKMLFEPHVFWRNLSGSERAQAEQIGIAYKAWRAGNYPADSYPRLSRAMQINETAALKAASWGLGQVLGENFVSAGYDSPQQMVVAFVDGGEAEQLQAMVRFIKANHLDDELRAHNWAAFARGYNGPQYAKHGYHTKLAAAFARWRKIKDTPWSRAKDSVGKPVPTPPVETTPLPATTGPLTSPAPRTTASVAERIDAIDPNPKSAPSPSRPASPPVVTGGFWSAFKGIFGRKA